MREGFPAMQHELKRRLESELSAYQTLETQYSKIVSGLNQLDSQLKENAQVLAEFKFVADDTIYKMIGPVLVKIDKDEAKMNVEKRLDYIRGYGI